MLVQAIVITGNGASADIYIPTDNAVADIAQMIDLAAGCNSALLYFYVVTNADVITQLCTRSQSGKRSDGAVTACFRPSI